MSVMAKGKILNVKCPKCKENFNYYDSESRPFCSERCKSVDLGHWFSENYTVASEEPLKEKDLELVIQELEKEN